MQAALGHVWHRFRYTANKRLAYNTAAMARKNRKRRGRGAGGGMMAGGDGVGVGAGPQAFEGDSSVDDAFATIMQWLHSRIPHTRNATS